MTSFISNLLTMLLALAFVLALAWLALKLLRARMQPRAAPGQGDDALRFVRALPVGPKERVVVIEHRGARWLLGVSGGGISTLAHWPAQGSAQGPAQPPAAAPQAPDFGAAIAAAERAGPT